MYRAERLRLRARSTFYGWWIVAGAFLIQTLQTGLLQQTYGAYATLLREEFGWSKTALSLAFALQSIESGMLGPVQGWMIDRFGPRAVMRLGVIMFGLGFILFSQLDSLLTFYLAFVVTATGASMSGFMTVTTMIINWFERRRSLAMGLMQTGMSIGGFMVPLVAWSLTANGWRSTSFASGIIVLALLLPLTRIMRRSPEEYGLLPDGVRSEERSARPALNGKRAAAEPRADFTTRQALRTPAFWFISFGHGLALVVVSVVTVHLVLHLVDDLNYSLSQAATVVAFMTGVMMVGRIIGGILGDRFEKRLVAALAMFGHAAGLFFLAFGESLVMVSLFAIAHGLAWGIRGPLMQAMRADYFGRKSFATIMGFSSMVIMVGTVSGPLLAGFMADYYGNYTAGFAVIASLSLLGTICFLLAKKPKPPRAAVSP